MLKVELTVNAPEVDFNEFQIHRKKIQHFLSYQKYLRPPYKIMELYPVACEISIFSGMLPSYPYKLRTWLDLSTESAGIKTNTIFYQFNFNLS